MAPDYHQILALSQKTFGKEFLPSLEIDAHGLLLDCSFVGLTGQVAFFQDKGNLSGFEPKTKEHSTWPSPGDTPINAMDLILTTSKRGSC